MARAGLTAKYRPQTFGEIIGQDFIKKILSRASQQDSPASAYLFSGTRGVGKTTTARIMAKAINCLNGPGLEPCNQCSSCQQITRGVFPDVMEIDGASHTGVDNVRRLREDAVYVPMSGRYKVIIIDEAHMLSTAAFNALLKTLEEPPRHCVFIMATTAPEKFPATVVSRCQHYVFKMVGLEELTAHLQQVLEKEGLEYDSEAVRLVAARGAGSVRDSMSILGQVMALGGDRLDSGSVREVLGLAGHEVYSAFFQSILDRDLVEIHKGISLVLEQGLDIGFFLQEFASCWRNLFLISQCGQAAREILDLPLEEFEFWLEMSGKMPAPRIHAGWQMVIEEQKNILRSHEPSLSLELLFFNLAYLPDLLPVEQVQIKSSESKKTSVQAGRAEKKSPAPARKLKDQPKKTSGPENRESVPAKDLDWAGFIEFCRKSPDADESLIRMLGNCTGRKQDQTLVLICGQDFIFDSIQKNGRRKIISRLAEEYFGPGLRVEFVSNGSKSNSAFRDEAMNHPVVQKIIKDFDARVLEIKKVQDRPGFPGNE
ncbi:DNA polymerase III subunit gamma/tau [Desulfonatronovibrio hydrogenovorans]|uniref:DNA polymerase III subunit gamma/tau n=1 Tax=Desulfonatronovibrio hydrogenovorans TaxID=53245 RepID=UPI00048E2F18|nr:DNA polymerase III subunit gamma/tau [Desulfonatronovibrio hydrogenovorans]